MTRLADTISVEFADGTALDAFGRLRVSQPHTLIDSKQVFDNQPLIWDELLETGSGITSAHSVARASTIISSTALTAGLFTRRTFMRFNYQSGKSQRIDMTGIIAPDTAGPGVVRRIGYFDDDNGIFFEEQGGDVYVVRRSLTSGVAVDERVIQADWNKDKMTGRDGSLLTADWAKTQIFAMDMEWLAVGRVRMCVIIGGKIHNVHSFSHSNVLDVAWMSTPNLPLTYQLETTSASPAVSLECLCATVISEGGSENLGVLRFVSNGSTFINANVIGTTYALLAIRLQAAKVGCSILIEKVNVIEVTKDDFLWSVVFNPTVAGTPLTFSNVADSCVQTAMGEAGNPSTSTITGGVAVSGGYVKSGGDAGSFSEDIANAIRLGVSIAGVLDEIYLAVTPLSLNADVYGAIQWRELQ